MTPRLTRLRLPLSAAAVFIALLILWRAAVWALNVPSYMLPPPGKVFSAITTRFPEIAPGLGNDSGISIALTIARPLLYRPIGILHTS